MSHQCWYDSVVVSPSGLKERIFWFQRGRGLGIKTQEEAHLFKWSAEPQVSRRWWRRGEMWGRAWVPGAREVNCTVCPPSGDNNSQSVTINQREKQDGTAEAAKCTEKCWRDGKRQRGRECNTCLWLFAHHLLGLRQYLTFLQRLYGSENKMLFHLEIKPNPCTSSANSRQY